MAEVANWFRLLFEIGVAEWPLAAGMGLLLALSAGFSASETALFSLTPGDLSRLRREAGIGGGSAGATGRTKGAEAGIRGFARVGARAAVALHGSLQRLLLSILFGNMAVNIAFFALAGQFGARAGAAGLPGADLAVGIGSLTAIILFGEVAPKNVAIVVRGPVVRLTSPVLLLWHRVAARPLSGLSSVVRFCERAIGVRAGGAALKREELRMLVDFSRADGVIGGAEHGLIDGVLDFPAVRMREVMTPRVDAVAVDAEWPVTVAVTAALEAGRPRVPVRHARRDEWLGWVDARALALSRADGSVGRWVRPPVYVSDLDRADQALAKLRREGAAMGFVVDERGVTVGLVTFSDLLAELFGALGDEEVDAGHSFREEGGGYVLPGAASVRDWRAFFEAGDEWPDCATLGGLLAALLGRTPRAGDAVVWQGVRMVARQVTRRRAQEIWLGPVDAAAEIKPEK